MLNEAPVAHRTRRAASVFIAGCLAVQIGLPLSYYAAGGEDERFAWRMFSSLGTRDCRVILEGVDARGAARTVDPFALVGPGWVERLQQGAPAIARGVLAELCAREGDLEEARLQRGCAGGMSLETVQYRCAASRVAPS